VTALSSNAPNWSHFDAWCDQMREKRLLGPGCGSAEFEGPDWREQALWRMRAGYRPGLMALYEAFAAERTT